VESAKCWNVESGFYGVSLDVQHSIAVAAHVTFRKEINPNTSLFSNKFTSV
jgi:hypothetical protein